MQVSNSTYAVEVTRAYPRLADVPLSDARNFPKAWTFFSKLARDVQTAVFTTPHAASYILSVQHLVLAQRERQQLLDEARRYALKHLSEPTALEQPLLKSRDASIALERVGCAGAFVRLLYLRHKQPKGETLLKEELRAIIHSAITHKQRSLSGVADPKILAIVDTYASARDFVWSEIDLPPHAFAGVLRVTPDGWCQFLSPIRLPTSGSAG
jgi:hypothetical protein